MEKRPLIDRLVAGLFILSLCGASFAYGVAATKWRWFPVPMIYKAKAAADAYLKLEAADDPPGMVRSDDDHLSPVITRHDSAAERDAILVTGGFGEHPQFCPRFGCLAWIMDRSGHILHTWEIDPASLFSEQDLATHSGFPKARNLIVQGVAPTADGGLVVTLQGRNMFPYYVGVFRLSSRGDVLWKAADFSHHWPTVLANGDIAIPKAEILHPVSDVVADTVVPSDCNGPVSAIYQEGMRIRDGNGAVLREFLFEDLLKKNDLKGLIYTVRDDCDPYHINGIAELNEAAARHIAHAEAGDLVISLRSPSALVILDRTDDVVHDILSGPMVAQHSPSVFPDGRIGVFDNLGGAPAQGGSRFLVFDLADHSHATLYPIPGSSAHLSSAAQGSVRLSTDGKRALIGETLNGRIIEVDLETGDTLWEFENYSDLTLFNQRVGSAGDHKGALMNAQGAHYIAIDMVLSPAFGANYSGPDLLDVNG